MSQKTITVGTAGTPADIDINFGNAQDNFTEIYTNETAQDAAISANTAKRSYPSEDETKLAGIEAGATADQTGAEIEALLDTELGGTAWKTSGGTDDQTASEVSFTPYSTIASTNVQAAIQEVLDEASGSAHSAVTIGTASGLSLSGQELSLATASAGVSGALSGTDWSTFNGKQDALTNPVVTANLQNSIEGLTTLDLSNVTLTLHESNALDMDITFETLSANGDVGTGADQVAVGNHDHSGTYEPADSTILKDADIGSTVQAYDATTTKTVASGTASLGTSVIASGASATAVTVSATGVVTTDIIDWGFNGDPTAVTGYVPSADGMLTIVAYPTANNINFKVINLTADSITPGAITLNWRVRR